MRAWPLKKSGMSLWVGRKLAFDTDASDVEQWHAILDGRLDLTFDRGAVLFGPKCRTPRLATGYRGDTGDAQRYVCVGRP